MDIEPGGDLRIELAVNIFDGYLFQPFSNILSTLYVFDASNIYGTAMSVRSRELAVK